jgi:glutathione synthase/RimK-type ligase-like ATP-grasp enzyme
MIAIITNRQDLTADFVVRELSSREIPFARLNTDEFPLNCTATAAFANGRKPTACIFWKNRPKPLDFKQITAIWYRRPVSPVVDSGITEPGAKQFAIDESYEFLRGLWYDSECFWMSHPDKIRQADHKMLQLATAQRCGFTIPKTVVTNCREQVLALYDECPTGIIAKPLYLGFLQNEDGGCFIYTTRLSQEQIDDAHSISLAPAIYQECIPKVADIRVTVVGEKVFAARILAENLPVDIPDWRFSDFSSLQHSAHALPPDEEDRCRNLVKSLGLEFGAIDYALDDTGRHVFLEINPNGQWAWLETTLGFPISAAIVDRLIEGAAIGPS